MEKAYSVYKVNNSQNIVCYEHTIAGGPFKSITGKKDVYPCMDTKLIWSSARYFEPDQKPFTDFDWRSNLVFTLAEAKNLAHALLQNRLTEVDSEKLASN